MSEPDELQISCKLCKVFIDNQDFQRIDDDMLLKFPIPPQVTADEYEAAQSLAKASE